MLFTCNKKSALWNSLKYSNFFKVELRNSHAAKQVFFRNDLDQETISVLSCLCYAIYTEWLDRKYMDIDRSYNDILLFIKMKLNYKMSIYKYFKWNKLTLKIETLLNSFEVPFASYQIDSIDVMVSHIIIIFTYPHLL